MFVKNAFFTNKDLVYRNWIQNIKENNINYNEGYEVWDYFNKQELFNESIELLEFWNGFQDNTSEEKLKIVFQLALLYEKTKQYENCKYYFYQVLDLIKQLKNEEYFEIYANVSFRLGRLLFESNDINDYETCLDLLYQAADFAVKLYGEASENTNIVFYTLGSALYSFGLLKQAYFYLKQSGYYLEQLYGLNNTYVQEIYKKLLNLSKKMLKFNDYFKWKNKLL